MTRVLVTEVALADLDRLIKSHSLPPDTRERLYRSLAPLASFPRLGAGLAGRWQDYRFILGPWRWMIIVYHYDQAAELLAVVTIQDGRSSTAATGER